MASLLVTEYSNVGRGYSGYPLPFPQEPAVAIQAVTFTTTTASAAFNAATRIVRVVADANCHVIVAASPTATTSHTYMAAGEPMTFAVEPGSSLKIAAVTA